MRNIDDRNTAELDSKEAQEDLRGLEILLQSVRDSLALTYSDPVNLMRTCGGLMLLLAGAQAWKSFDCFQNLPPGAVSHLEASLYLEVSIVSGTVAFLAFAISLLITRMK